MIELSAPVTGTVIRRGGSDMHGDPVGDDAHHSVAGGIDWNATTSNLQFQDVQETDADWYVPRAADIVASDKVDFADYGTFRVLGKPMWDQVHPMTGTDYGYKLVRLREVAGA